MYFVRWLNELRLGSSVTSDDATTLLAGQLASATAQIASLERRVAELEGVPVVQRAATVERSDDTTLPFWALIAGLQGRTKALEDVPGGGGSAAWTEHEIDFGSAGVYDATFTVIDAAVSVATEVAVVQSGATATDRASGDALWDAIVYAATPAAGSFTLYALAQPGPVAGKRKILYQVGT